MYSLSQDAGALGAVSEAGAFKKLNADITDLVDAQYRAADGTWVGVSGRSRVLSYDPNQVSEAELPKSIFDLADPAWKGKIGIAPTNASFQAAVTAMRVVKGDAETSAWLKAMKTNAVLFEKNGQILEAVETGSNCCRTNQPLLLVRTCRRSRRRQDDLQDGLVCTG